MASQPCDGLIELHDLRLYPYANGAVPERARPVVTTPVPRGQCLTLGCKPRPLDALGYEC